MKKTLKHQRVVPAVVVTLAAITVMITLCGRMMPDYWQTNYPMLANVLVGLGACVAAIHLIRRGRVGVNKICYTISLPALCAAYFFFNCSALPVWRWRAGAFCFFVFGIATIIFMASRYRREIVRFSGRRQIFLFVLLTAAVGLALKFVVVPLSVTSTPINGSALLLYVAYRMIFAAIFAFSLVLSASVMNWPDIAYLLTLSLLHASGFGWVHRFSGESITILNWSWQIWNASLFLLFGLMLLSCDAHRSFLDRRPTFSGGGSVRVVLTSAVFSGTLLMLLGLIHTNVFVVGDGVRLSALLSAGACTWAFAACLGLAVSERLRAVRAQMLSGLNDGRIVAEKNVNLGPIILAELRGWLSAYNRAVAKSNMLTQKMAEREGNVALSEIAAQVSHDIRSPLAALSMLAQGASWSSDDEQILFSQAVKRIEGIADDLVEKRSMKDFNSETMMASALVQQIVAEKLVLLRDRKSSICLNVLPGANAYGLFISGNIAHLERVISNLLNNALEAVSQSTGVVHISTERAADKVVIKLADNGPGIPDEVLCRLGAKGATFNKPGGRGLGLYHAINTVDSHDGNITVQRLAPSPGTLVQVTLPQASPPAWFVDQLRVGPASTVMIVDDDPSVHGLWRRRLQGIASTVVGVSSVRELDAALEFSAVPHLHDVFLVDYDLKDSKRNGLDIISKIGQNAQKILVTSHHENLHLQAECQRKKIKMLPKAMVAWIPIVNNL